MEIKINIAKKHLYILMAFVLAVAGIVLVIGYGTTSPSSFGHSAGELDLTPIYIVGSNVGIGTTSPTVQFERVCPAGFTNVKAGNNQLGCMETDEHGTGTFYTAANTCFTTYGGRLPYYDEWYVTMNNYALERETGNWEWLGNSDYYSASACAAAGESALTNPNVNPCGKTGAYRCWIPR